MRTKNSLHTFLLVISLLMTAVSCLEKTEPNLEAGATVTIEQQDLEYCTVERTSNSPYANSGEVNGSTPLTAYTICTEEQFIAIGETPTDWNKHFLLKADLDFVHYDLDANQTYKPIGVYRTSLSSGDTDFDGVDDVETDYDEDDHPFTGVFNGNDHTIYRFRATFINDEDHEYRAIGMFPYLSVPGVIKNLKLVKHRVMKSDDDEVEFGMGMLVGFNDGGEIDNVHIDSGSMYAGDNRVGGMVGLMGGGRILNSSVEFEDNVTGDDNVGGLVGELSDALILQCSVVLNQITGDNNIGGLVGYSHRSTIRDTKVYLSGNVEGQENNIGGFIGLNSSGPILYSSVELNSVEGNENVGGFVGENDEGEIHYSSVVSRQSITSAEDFAGGFVGLNTESPITNSSVQLQNISGRKYVGGFIGESVESDIENNEVEIKNLLTVSHHGGGLIGKNTGGLIYGSNVQVLSIVATNNECPEFATTGGLIGEALDGQESEGRIVYSQANIMNSITGFGIVGGLVGKNNVEINYSQAVSNLIEVSRGDAPNTATDHFNGRAVGGLVGFNYSDGHYQSGRIEYSYAINSNTIYGEGDVGGLVGQNGFYRDLQIENSGVNPICGDGSEDINGYRHPGGEIQFSYVDGEIIYSGNEGHNVGGFIGSGWESRVQASYADIDQSVYGQGYSNPSTAIKIYPVENIGGFIGFALDSSVRSSYARVAQVYGSYRNVAGFVGQSETSTFMYNFAISDVEGFSPEGICHNPANPADPTNEVQIKITKEHPTEELCGAVGSCTGDSSYEDRESCNESGYCYDSANDFSNTELQEYDTPETCIQAGACFAFSVAYNDAATYLRAEAQGNTPDEDHAPLDEESLNLTDDGVDHVDYREKCLASYSCIDANGELVEGVTTYEECVSGGMCLTSLVSKGVDYDSAGDSITTDGILNVDTDGDGDGDFDCTDGDSDLVCDVGGDADKPSRYDRTPNGTEVDNHVLSDGRMPDYFLRAGSDGEVIRDRGSCCQDGGLENQNHPHEILWVANKWVKNYWLPTGFSWTYGRKTSNLKECVEWNNQYTWTSTRSEENGSHTVPDVGRFAGGFDFHWSVENERYYHESLWVQNYVSDYAENTCSNPSGAVVSDESPSDATASEAPEVDAYECGKVSSEDFITFIDNTGVPILPTIASDPAINDQVTCHDFNKRIDCDNVEGTGNRDCDCVGTNDPETSNNRLLEFRQKRFIFAAEDVISCDDAHDPSMGGSEEETSGDTVIDHDEDQTVIDLGEPETCNDSMVAQFELQDQLRVSYWVDNSEQSSSGCGSETDDEWYDEEYWDDWYLETTSGRKSVEEGDCYYERYFYKKENAPLKFWDFYHFWDSYYDKYPTLQKVDQ